MSFLNLFYIKTIFGKIDIEEKIAMLKMVV